MSAEGKILAAEMTIKLSGYLIMCALVMLLVDVIFLSFCKSPQDSPLFFLIPMIVSMIMLIISIVFAGKGIAKIIKDAREHNCDVPWKHESNSSGSDFNLQAVFCFIGIFLFFASLPLVDLVKTFQ